MSYFIIKTLLTALIITIISEIGRRWTMAAAILASLPLTSILAMIWLYYDSHEPEKIISLSHGIFWSVLPSLLFFLTLPFLLKSGFKFSTALILASTIMAATYIGYIWILKRWGIQF